MKYIIDLPDDWRPPKPKDCPASCPWFEWDGDDCNVYCHPAKCPLANAISLRDEERKQGEVVVIDRACCLRIPSPNSQPVLLVRYGEELYGKKGCLVFIPEQRHTAKDVDKPEGKR